MLGCGASTTTLHLGRELVGEPADRTIAAIALESGFGDVSYFNRTFRRTYGATPSEMREQALRAR